MRALDRLSEQVVELGQHAHTAVSSAVDALRRRDTAEAEWVVAADENINRRRFELEQAALAALSSGRTRAADLRLLTAVLHIVTDLERIGDHASSIARICLRLDDPVPEGPAAEIALIAAICLDRLRRAMQALAQRSSDLALTVAEQDAEIDRLERAVRGELMHLEPRPDRPKDVAQLTHLLRVAHDLERIGDHVTNICERVVFAVTGHMAELRSSSGMWMPAYSHTRSASAQRAGGSDPTPDVRGEAASLVVERNRAAAVLASMTDGIVVTQPDLSIERMNAAARELLDATSQACLGLPVRDIAGDRLGELLRQALADNGPQSVELQLGARTVRATGVPIPPDDAAGEASGLLVLQDVSELRRGELSRREFVANVSHELRTPLASVKALAETLESRALEDPPAAREFLGQMNAEVDNLTQLVEELLELSGLESGSVAVRAERVAPATMARQAIRRLAVQAERAGLTVTLEAPPRLPAVRADPRRITQVLLNLLHNAIKFTPSGGRITVRLERLGAEVQFAVIDTGSGIAARDLARIFERFYKADRSRASIGTGLGLAIAKHSVQAHGGRIWADSAGEGRGTTLAFTLPLTLP